MHVNPLHTVSIVAEIFPSGAATVAVGSATVAVGGGVPAGEPATFVAEGGEPEADGSCKS